MIDQEILNRIDAEIAAIELMLTHYTIGYSDGSSTIGECNAYIEGIRFARALIEKRKEEVEF
jgi:hypothetical protein